MKDIKSNKHIQLSEAGFTLIEVLIAITVLSILMATMYTIVSNSTDSKDKIIAEDRDALQLITALDRMEQDFSQLYSPLYHSAKYVKKASDQNEFTNEFDQNGNPTIVSPLDSFQASERFPSISTSADIVPVIQNESKSEIIFMTTSNRRILKDSKQSRFGWVKYALRSSTRDEDDRKEGADYELVRSIETENIYNKEFDWKNVKEYPLLRDLKSFQFLFWNSKTEKFVDRLELLSTDQQTPRLIRVNLVWINSDNNEIEISRTFRPLSPYFDTEKDEKEKEAARAGSKQADTPNSPNSTFNNENENEEDE
ncbi:type II secretion system protein J [Halobacteriovorax sp.]|uniref:type II secretion system protein J n=1 Tax=Halobacteriovorax sp. TaxID=2020862 RepID=UPI00356448DC